MQTEKINLLELFAGSRSFSKVGKKLNFNVFSTDIIRQLYRKNYVLKF